MHVKEVCVVGCAVVVVVTNPRMLAHEEDHRWLLGNVVVVVPLYYFPWDEVLDQFFRVDVVSKVATTKRVTKDDGKTANGVRECVNRN
jgi:hypothetical protein